MVLEIKQRKPQLKQHFLQSIAIYLFAKGNIRLIFKIIIFLFHYSNILICNLNKSNSSREFWQTVNKMKGKFKPSKTQTLKNYAGQLVTTDSEKAELLNDIFADVGKN